MSGTLVRIAGPVVVAKGIKARMFDVVLVGKEELVGEVIQIKGDEFVIQVYEDTSGLAPGAPVKDTGAPLSVELGPGLLKSIYDGVQRPLEGLMKKSGAFLARGARLPGLDQKKRWAFKATAKDGEQATEGAVLGEVEEVKGFTHRVLVPPGVSGQIKGLRSGEFTIQDEICKVGDTPINLAQRWPVRKSRPVQKKRFPEEPLLTGQRIIDVLFPIAKGGTAIIPGPFGSGKTVMQQALAKFCDADIIVYIGCGERGNEMTEVLTEFPELKDPRNGEPLMNRTVLIANTSNMPVAAREASIYTGITIAEYFRDMGYDVALMADSTSRWAEALREISSRLEEMPGEEGYPAYLASRIAAFYERAGPVVTLAGAKSSLSVVGAVSPPGGDFFEPVTQNSLRVAKVFWALDAKLAQQRHFPSVNWLESYSLYRENLEEHYAKSVDPQWSARVNRLGEILQQESQLMELVQLVGSDALPPGQQLTLHIARLVREIILQQSAFDERDWFSPLEKSSLLMRLVLAYYDKAKAMLESKGMEGILAKRIHTALYDLKVATDYQTEGKEIEKKIASLTEAP